MGEWRYSSTILDPGDLMNLSGQHHDPDALTQEKKPPVPIGKEAV
jgi:hypothetical protein